MDETTPENRHNVQRQLAIFEVARQARGKNITEIKQMLREAFARRRLTAPPGTWLESVASEASYGKPYIVDLDSAETATTVAPAPDAIVQQSLQQRLRLRMPRRRPAGAGRHSAAPEQTGAAGTRRRAASGTDENLAAVRALVAGAVALTLAAAAVMLVRSRRHPAAGLVTAGRPAP
jgi:hypothetical protein